MRHTITSTLPNLDVVQLLHRADANGREGEYHSNNSEPPAQTTRILSGYMDVHSEETGDKVERHKDRSKDSNLAK